mgnify:CR=1 FL=1
MGYGERILFKDLNLDIYRGEKVALIGANGIGKSTLFNALTSAKNAQSANYPFCTIEPNVGVVSVPDNYE